MGQVDTETYDFKVECEQESLGIPDCNKCVYVDNTENEKHIGHYCRKYNKRVFHRTNNREHDSYIWPCRDCLTEGCTHYREPLTNREAADILESTFVKIMPARGNSKSMRALKYTEAMMKAISLLRNTSDE